jgi:hypothetical protein
LSHRVGKMAAMYFSPHTATLRPCWHCTHFLALVYQGSAAKCRLGGIHAMPAHGCAFWEREVGADDEPGPPVGADVVCPPVVGDQPMTAVAWAP